jgi:hypothetical protein
MEVGLAFFAGMFFKLADEILDVKYPALLEYSEYIKTYCVFFFSFVFYKYPELAICFLFIIAVCYYVNQIDTTFWKSMIPLPLFTLLMTYQNLHFKGTLDLFEKMSVLTLILLFTYIEDKSFPEETSDRKKISRIFLILLCTATFLILPYFQNPEILYVVNSLIISYYATSVVIQSSLVTP